MRCYQCGQEIDEGVRHCMYCGANQNAAPTSVAEPAPMYEAPAPAAEPAPMYEAPAPAAEPAPVYEAPAPATETALVHEAPAPAAEPAPVYEAPAPAAEPAPVYEAPAPAAEPAPVYTAPASAAGTAPVYEPAPTYAPAYAEPAPQSAPVYGAYGAAPAYGAYVPPMNPYAVHTAPVVYAGDPRPALQLPTKRGLAKMLFLGLITLGIYNVVIYTKMVTDLNIVASRYDGRRTMPYFAMVFLAPLTLGILPWVWSHNMCDRIGDELRRRGIDYKFSASVFWLWNVLGSLILVGPFIYIHKLMKAMNLLCKDYNKVG